MQRWKTGGVTFTELCRQLGMSRKTGFKRVERYKVCGTQRLGVTGPVGTTGTHQFDWCHVFSYQSLMPAGAGRPRYENWVHWLIEGSGVVCATHPAPSWGQAPALHFSCDPGLSLFGRRWFVSPAGAGIHPGSESGTCFRTNRSCRRAPAHQGVKMRPGRWKCLGVVGATLPLWIPAFAGMTNSVAGTIRFRTKTGGGLAFPPPLWIPAFAGMTSGGRFASRLYARVGHRWMGNLPFSSLTSGFTRYSSC